MFHDDDDDDDNNIPGLPPSRRGELTEPPRPNFDQKDQDDDDDDDDDNDNVLVFFLLKTKYHWSKNEETGEETLSHH